MTRSALDIALAYHGAWTSGDVPAAARLLSSDATFDVPLNAYSTKDSFISALRSFGGATRRVDVLASFEGIDDDSCLIYDMEVKGLGTLRVAEYFKVVDSKIVVLRQIHDTADLRAAGFGPPEPDERR